MQVYIFDNLTALNDFLVDKNPDEFIIKYRSWIVNETVTSVKDEKTEKTFDLLDRWCVIDKRARPRKFPKNFKVMTHDDQA